MTTADTLAAPASSARTIWGRGAVAALVAAVLNLVLAIAAAAVFDIDSRFIGLQPVPVIAATLITMMAGTGVFLLIRRFAARPERIFTIVALAFAVISVASPLSLLGASQASQPGVSDTAALCLIPLHLIPAPVLLAALTRRKA
ncbi:DUF6069 family protein [Streptomyces sp. NK08204]|uniref:DUF6069 family protein n=1 Tax=Streptomyces sp. NK08204 TaxID=2873260 RepID=UPI001CED49EC|nr:DUF6069 family protein [Streptomyces sp. NK08204]